MWRKRSFRLIDRLQPIQHEGRMAFSNTKRQEAGSRVPGYGALELGFVLEGQPR